MESALRPRDIQARIRAGESPEDVAAAAGVTVESIAAFAAPVIAEREHVVGLASANPVRRRGETTSHRGLRNAVADSLVARGVDADDAEWDSWKIEDRRWAVRVSYAVGDTVHEALFAFDQNGRFSTATNDQARALIGDGPAARDDLALVDAVKPPAEAKPAETTAAAEATSEPGEEPTAPDADEADEVAVEDEPRSAEGSDERGTDEAGDGAEVSDAHDAYQEGQLEEVDGVLEIVADEDSGMDVLYDMLSSFDEDSVRIYAGLVHPKDPAAPPSPVEAVPVAGATEKEPAPKPPAPKPGATAKKVSAVEQQVEKQAEPPAPATEPEQAALIEDKTPPKPAPRPRTRKKRASVPSWDEIMFGGPKTDA